jgi:glycosyltransferase involved in cell wall biosynthesis
MADSIHLAKWLHQFASDPDYEFRLVSSSPHRKVHPIIEELVSSGKVRMGVLTRYFSLPLWIADRVFSDWLRGALLAVYANAFKPDLVHVNEFQNAGYSYLRARQLSGAIRRAKLLVTPYGSDIYWFQQFPNHLARIKNLLAHTSAVSAECRRDEILAEKYGFKGVFGPRIPAFGSIELNLERALQADRTSIAIKGYQNHWGQALIALEVVRKLAHELTGFTIELFSCNRVTIQAAKKLAEETGLSVIAHPKGTLSNSEVQDILNRSLAMIALSKSDGISASMIEAMVNGAVPIQSRTSCCDEWLDNGVGGFLVDFDDVAGISKHLRFLLDTPGFRESAASHNISSLSTKLDPSQLEGLAKQTYEIALNS